MNTETTSQLPPCPLPDCEGGEHHTHDINVYALKEEHDCAREARIGYRCYDPHRTQSPQWQPIELDQIRAGMRIRATTTYRGCVINRTGVAHHTSHYGNWYTERNWTLTGWAAPTTYEVDPATIPADPDAELIEKISKAIDDADKLADEWGSADAYRKLARAALSVIRAEEREQA